MTSGRLSMMLTLTYAATAASVLLGWLSTAQLAVTFALEIVVALLYSSRRILHSEGVVQRGGQSWEINGRRVTAVAGRPMTPEQRRLVSGTESILFSVFCLMSAFFVVATSGSDLLVGPLQVFVWVTLTATAVWSERERYRDWRESDAPLTADPTRQTSHPAARSMAFFAALFAVMMIGPETRFAALLLVVQAFLVDWYHQRADRTDPPPAPPTGPGGADTPPRWPGPPTLGG